MELYYENTDISNLVQIKSCIVHDGIGRSDSIELTLENAKQWYAWGTNEDDTIAVIHNGYDSGTMFVNRVLPEDGEYRIYATSLPCKSRAKGYRSFADKSVKEILRLSAAYSGMSFAIFGIDGGAKVPYIEQNNETLASFLNRLIELEGAVLKCVNGKYTAIGIEYAQNMAPIQTIEIAADTPGVCYVRGGNAYRSVTLKSTGIEAKATDTSVDSSHIDLVKSGIYPIRNKVQASKWARSVLRYLNRDIEILTIEQTLNPSLTAMVRIDITGGTDADGEWMVYGVDHDLINLRSTSTLYRVNNSII